MRIAFSHLSMLTHFHVCVKVIPGLPKLRVEWSVGGALLHTILSIRWCMSLSMLSAPRLRVPLLISSTSTSRLAPRHLPSASIVSFLPPGS